jgi:toxin-antitoxin system PIN domain toxin
VEIADVNVLLYAHRPESGRHDEYREWLEARLVAPEPFGVSELVLSAVIRISTNHRVYVAPTPPATAVQYGEDLRAGPSTVTIRPGPRHWAIFAELCTSVQARANVVPDAYLAALAIEHGATWLTADTGFARFPGLRWRHPLAER